jgi:sulfatase modifying factor 1
MRRLSGLLVVFLTLCTINAPSTYSAPVEFSAAGQAFVEVRMPDGRAFGIGKYEVTVSDYVDFLNSAAATDPYNLYAGNTDQIARLGSNGSYVYSPQAFMGQKPIWQLTWFHAARYVNWLHNGGGNGSTETGVYELNGENRLVTERNPNARFWIPSDEEWLEAAYGKGDRDPLNYWTYATQSDELPAPIFVDIAGNGQATGSGNSANYGTFEGPNRLATIGTSGGPSYYGAFDMSGNIAELVGFPTPPLPGLWWSFGFDTRGGAWDNGGSYMAVNNTDGSYRIGQAAPFTSVGLRLATVPEPSRLWISGLVAGAAYLMAARHSCGMLRTSEADDMAG